MSHHTLSFEIALLSLHKWSRPKNIQVDLSIHIGQPVLQVYTNPILLTTIDQHKEGILLLGAGVNKTDWWYFSKTTIHTSTEVVQWRDSNMVTLHCIVYKREILLLGLE